MKFIVLIALCVLLAAVATSSELEEDHQDQFDQDHDDYVHGEEVTDDTIQSEEITDDKSVDLRSKLL
jgi:uncharacterized protein YdeI (BOF family)